MVFRYLLGQVIRETAQSKLTEALDAKSQPIELPETCDVAVVFALGIEAGGFCDKLESPVSLRGEGYVEHIGRLGDRIVTIVETGAGRASAAAAIECLLKTRPPCWVVAAGFASGLDETLRGGEFLMADAVTGVDGESLDIGLTVSKESLAATPGVHVGRLLSTDQVLRSPHERRAMAHEHRALACDMETLAIAQVCQAAKQRMLAVRIISDAVDDELPPEAAALLDQPNLARKLGAAAGAIWNRPSSVKDMWGLKEQALKASDRLAKFLVGVIQQLPVE